MRGRYQYERSRKVCNAAAWVVLNRDLVFFVGFQSHLCRTGSSAAVWGFAGSPPRELPRRFLCLGSVGGKLVAHLHQTCHIHLGADLFHAMQDLRDRKLNGFEETELFALIQHTGQIFGQKPPRLRCG